MNGPFPRVHPRHFVVGAAEAKFRKFWLELCQEHDLTAVEQLQMLCQEQGTLLAFCLRHERQPACSGCGDSGELLNGLCADCSKNAARRAADV